MIKIVQGNDVNLHVPLVEKDAEGVVTAIDFANVTDLAVSLSKGSEAFTDFTTYTAENTVVICLNENAPRGSYSILITAKNNGVDICYNAKSAFEIVRYNAESTYTDYIADEDVTLDTGLFVAAIVNDEQVEELREELQAKIAETEQAKADYDTAKENLTELAEDLGGISETVENAVEDAMQDADVAKQGTDPTVTLTIIKGLLDNLDLNNVAKQGTDPTATLTAIKSALDNMDISNVAKQGSNPNATNTAILAAFGNIDFSTLAKQGVNSAATNTAILSAITSIDLSSLATLSGQQSAATDLLTLKTRIGEATDATTANTLFGKIAAVLSAISNIDFSSVASQTSVDAIQSGVTDLITAIASVATETNATANKNAILNDIAAKASAILGTDTTATLTALKTAIASLSIPTVQQIQSGLAKTSELPTDYAKQGANTSATLSDTQGAVKNSTTTALAELLNNTYGLAALQTLIGAITGYALQGSDPTATNTAIKNAIANIDLSAVAKQGSDATATLTAVASAIATLATAVAAIPTTTPATPTDVSNAQTAIIGAMPSVSGLASETSVKDGNDTAISMLKDGTFGLSAIKTIVQAISGYALQGSDPTATNTAILSAILSNVGTPQLTIPNTTATQELASNTVYLFESRTNNLTLTLGTPIAGQNNEYHFFLFVGATAPSITYPSGISWNGGSAPTITASKSYEISINNNIAAYFEI